MKHIQDICLLLQVDLSHHSLPTFSTFSAVSVSTYLPVFHVKSPVPLFILLFVINIPEWRRTRQYLFFNHTHPHDIFKYFQCLSVSQNRKNQPKSAEPGAKSSICFHLIFSRNRALPFRNWYSILVKKRNIYFLK